MFLCFFPDKIFVWGSIIFFDFERFLAFLAFFFLTFWMVFSQSCNMCHTFMWTRFHTALYILNIFEWLLEPNCHQMKVKNVIHSWVKYNMPNRPITRLSQVLEAHWAKELCCGIPLIIMRGWQGGLRAFVNLWNSDVFTLGSLSLDNFCNGTKQRNLPAKMRNLPAKRRNVFGTDLCVLCCWWKGLILKMKCLTDWIDSVDRASASQATKEPARMCFCVQSKRWKNQVSATFWGCVISLSLRFCFD